MSDQYDLEKAREGYKQLRADEKKLTERLGRLPTWSAKWWLVLHDIDIRRGQIIFLRELLTVLSPTGGEGDPFAEAR